MSDTSAFKNSFGGTSIFQLWINLRPGLTRKQAETLRDKVGVAVKDSIDVKVFEHCEGGYHGPTLCEKLEAKMDERRKAMEKATVETGETDSNPKWVKNQGAYLAYADAIATIRQTRLKVEVARSNERLGIE